LVHAHLSSGLDRAARLPMRAKPEIAPVEASVMVSSDSPADRAATVTTLESSSLEARPARSRRAIAVLLNHTSFFTEGIEGRLRRAFDTECVRRDFDLYLFYGRSLEEPDPSCAAYNAVFELVHPDRVDAVILVSNLLAGFCGGERLDAYAQRYRALPRCSIGMALTNLPSLEVDNRPGMLALMEHLVLQHGYRRFAFVGGQVNHPHSIARLDACREVLVRHGLTYDPELVVYGEFMTHAAEVAMDELLNRRSDFDVVVAVNDAMALGVIASLRKHGRDVPADCAVTGYDDLIHARLGNPPMTTVAQPLEALVTGALDTVQAQWEGRQVPELVRIPAEFSVRDSCGCSVRTSGAVVRSESTRALSPIEYLQREWARIHARIESLLGESRASERRTGERLLRALQAELSGEGPAMVAVTRELLNAVRNDPEHFRAWYGAVELLEGEFAAFSVPGLEAVWRGVQRELVLALTASHLQQQMAMDFTYVQLLGSEDNVFGALKLGALQVSLQRHLPTVGIGTVSLSEYVDGDSNQLQPLVHFVDGLGHANEVGPFPAHCLFPPDKPLMHRYTFVVMPLVFEARALGMSVLEYARGPIPYHLLRDQIAAALGTYRLQREIEHQSALRERSVQERLAATQRMESLSLLAGGVAHDLNNVLGPLVALPDLMLSQLSNANSSGEFVEEFQSDIELIKVAGQRASQTIKDLLTLSRQGRTAKFPIDLNRILRECGEQGAARRLRLTHARIHVSVETPESPLVIMGSEAHIVRAITNLIQNAIDATEGKGELRMCSYALDLALPLDGYETIAAGVYAVIEVSDDGCGLPTDRRQRIFEPFFSTKDLGPRSGTGLGLAIVHGVVKEHEGFIDVDSQEGRGTTFRLYFPLSQSKVITSRPPLARKAGGERILVVDDEPIQLRTCRRVLTHCGYHVDVTTSGADAFDRFVRIAAGEANGYDLVLLDVQLSGGEDGLEIYERIRQVVPAQRAVLASGHAPTHRIEAALERGIPWLQKPYTSDALADIVRSALDAASAGIR
jgi:signal transduction histidine kinase/DNA-binding LacI/PurR family transcriptional regulator/ActR/RegA family two-component response regulator